MNLTADPSLYSLLTLENREATDDSRTGVVSLPIPPGAEAPTGLQGLPTQGVDLAWWPSSRSGAEALPRRRMLYVISPDVLPASLRVGAPAPLPADAVQPSLALRSIRKDYQSLLPHHSSELVLHRGGTEIALRLGLRWRQELHWWQWVRLTQVWAGPVASAYRLGGAIEVVPLSVDDVFPGRKERHIRRSEWLHRQNWLFGEVYLVCFANGVVQVHCRHINGHQFDEGRDQHDVVPIIGLRQKAAVPVDLRWTGAEPRIRIGTVTLDLSDCATLVSEAHPGSLRTQDDLVIFQPYEGIEIGGNAYNFERDDGLFVDAAQRLMPRGVARTVRFCLGLGEAAPVVARFAAPEWWHAVTCDVWPDAVLPVRDAWDSRIDALYERNIAQRDRPGRFDDHAAAIGREGEIPYVQFTYAYRTGNPQHWRRAVRDAYHMADIAFDHATETIRMHNYPFDGTISPALFRVVGMLYGYLETGDPYLRECSESATLSFVCLDRHTWPRHSYGRDAMSIRSLVFLADYLGSEQYRQWAREALSRVVQCQLPDGSYHDQGGGTGIHSVGQLPIKPWMANMATNPIIDYLERWSDDPILWAAAVKFGDFLLKSGTQPDGDVRWPYQVSYAGTNYDPWKEFFDPGTTMAHLPDKSSATEGYEARSLCVLTRRTRNPAYFDAWLKYYDRYVHNPPPKAQGWSLIKGIQFLPYAQAHAWNARWRGDRVVIAPLPSLYRTELCGTILTPLGPLDVRLRRPDPARADQWIIAEAAAPAGVQVELAPPDTSG